MLYFSSNNPAEYMKNIAFAAMLLLAMPDLFANDVDSIVLTNQTISVDGALKVANWLNNHPNEEYPNYPQLYYAFAEGDELVLDFFTENKKGTQIVEVTDYESKAVLYSNNSIQNLQGLKLKVPRTSIYKISVTTNHLFDRQCRFVLKCIPDSEAPSGFSRNVAWKTKQDTSFLISYTDKKINTGYEAVSLQTPINHFLNGGLNATFSTGRSRLTFPITLPPNTVEWYYSFAATRNRANVQATRDQMKLLSTLSKMLGGGVLSIGVDMLAQPPGADYCDVYLLPAEHFQAFERKEDTKWRYITEGTRPNVMYGNVKVSNCCKQGTFYIGLKNPSNSYGVEVVIEVVAIVEKATIEKVQVKTPVTVKTTKVPVFATN